MIAGDLSRIEAVVIAYGVVGMFLLGWAIDAWRERRRR